MHRWIAAALLVACNTDPVATVDDPASTSTGMAAEESESSTTAVPSEGSTSTGESSSSGAPADSCGNGVIDPGEVCDGDAVAQEGVTCESKQFLGGTIACGADCDWDVSGCTPAGCGNGALEPGEDCDGTQIREGITCGSLGFVWERGELSCAADCTVDTSACVACGWTPDPVGGACPAECNGGCSNDTCLIDCSAGNCFDPDYAPITCPPGWHCDISCADGELGGCIGRTIECPPEYGCSIECISNACTFADIRCNDGPCDISCDDDEYACLTQFACGTNACHASCTGTGKPAMGCYLSCDCESC